LIILKMAETSMTASTVQLKMEILDPASPKDVKILKKIVQFPNILILDQLTSQVLELIKLKNPSRTFSGNELEEEAEFFMRNEGGDLYGNWVYYPWKNCLVRVLPEQDFVAVRTARNKYKITDAEQELLKSKKIGIIGLSVGQSVALGLAMERTCGEIRIADFDTLELSNMNRIRAGVADLGLLKVELVYRQIVELDPYLKIMIFEKGITKDNMDHFFLDGGKLDLLIEECDSLDIKIASRLKAKSLQVPVLMDTSDRGMVDIERYDLQPDLPLFNGLLTSFGPEAEILNTYPENKPQLLGCILDFEQLSEKAKFSISQIGKTITNWPQLASSVVLGGGICTHYAREILCGNKIVSGRVYFDLDEIEKSRHES
jgi:molybdopterin/thiamine biosynthesis adenylyltransferase